MDRATRGAVIAAGAAGVSLIVEGGRRALGVHRQRRELADEEARWAAYHERVRLVNESWKEWETAKAESRRIAERDAIAAKTARHAAHEAAVKAERKRRMAERAKAELEGWDYD